MKKIYMYFSFIFVLFSQEAVIEYSKGSYFIEKNYKIGEIFLNGSDKKDNCNYRKGDLVISFNENSYRNYYDNKLEISKKNCDLKKLNIEKKLGSYIFRTGNVYIYNKKENKKLDSLTYGIRETLSIKETDGKRNGYEYGQLLYNNNVLFQMTYKHNNFFDKSLEENKNTLEAKANPNKKIKYNYDESRSLEKIYKNHQLDSDYNENIVFFSE